MKKIDIKTVWDDDFGNIDNLKNGDFNIKMTGNFDKWDALSKLDYFSDLESWLQTQINNIHKNSDPKESFVYSYIMGTPKSSEQQEADKDPVQYKKRQEAARELMTSINQGGDKFNNVIRFPNIKKKENKENE